MKGERGEQLLQQALEVEPDAPDLLNNLAAAYEMQGRGQEAKEIIRQVHENYPDYLFACVGMAKLYVSEGKLDEAEALLRPLLSRKRFHFSEFDSLCEAQVMFLLAQDNRDATRSWLDMWAGTDPEEPAIEHWRERLRKPSLLQRFFGRRADTRKSRKKRRTGKYRVGDAVRVKPGAACPDAPNLDISGWQGRVTDLAWADDPTEPTIGFAWDSLSLQAMPEWFIEDSVHKGLNWSQMYLEPDEIELAEPRDTEQDTQQAVARILRETATRFEWLDIGPEGERIQAVLNTADGPGELQVLYAWEKHLNQNLQFPFAAEVDEFQERGPLQTGDRLKVLRIEDVDDLYGIIVSCLKDRRRYHFPLADLTAMDENSPNAQLIQDYRVWFANR